MAVSKNRNVIIARSFLSGEIIHLHVEQDHRRRVRVGDYTCELRQFLVLEGQATFATPIHLYWVGGAHKLRPHVTLINGGPFQRRRRRFALDRTQRLITQYFSHCPYVATAALR